MSSSKPLSFDPNSFSLTDEAVLHFQKKLIDQEDAIGVRFSVKENDGCSGYSYEMDYVKKAQDGEDFVLDCSSFKVFVDNNSFKYLMGTKVDFLIEGVNQGIIFNNPNVTAVCGCGESFDIA